MKILFAGATGFIGQALYPRLAKRGHEITVVTRDIDNARKLLGSDISALSWKDLDSLTNHDFDAAINLCGETIAKRWTKAYKAEMFTSRIGTTRRIADALARSSKSSLTLLNASGTGSGHDLGDREVTEADSASGSFLADLTAQWERAVEPNFSVSEQSGSGRRAVFLRFGPVLHPHTPLWTNLSKPIGWGVGGPLGSGKQWFPFVTLHDALRAIMFLLESNHTGPFIITAPNPARQKEFGALLAKRLGKPFFLRTPGFILKLALGEMAVLALQGQRSIPRRLLEAGFRFDYPDAETAIDYCMREEG